MTNPLQETLLAFACRGKVSIPFPYVHNALPDNRRFQLVGTLDTSLRPLFWGPQIYIPEEHATHRVAEVNVLDEQRRQVWGSNRVALRKPYTCIPLSDGCGTPGRRTVMFNTLADLAPDDLDALFERYGHVDLRNTIQVSFGDGGFTQFTVETYLREAFPSARAAMRGIPIRTS